MREQEARVLLSLTKQECMLFPFLLMFVKMLCFEAGDEIVDLTCESLEPVVVDLTHNDSVVVSLALSSGPGSTRSTGLGNRLGLCRRNSVMSQHRCFREVACGFVACGGKTCVPLTFPQWHKSPWGQTPRGPLSLVPDSTLHPLCDPK